MKASEFRGKTLGELNDELSALQKEQFNLRIQKNAGGNNPVRPHSFKQVRRKIAQIKTILNEKTRADHE